ncbi:MAG: Ig-like domain-containing protein [Dehalococcoidia bacterium]
MAKSLALMTCATMAFLSSACDEASPLVVGDPIPTAIQLSVSNVTIQVGQSLQLEAEVLDEEGDVIPDMTFSWSSEETDVVAVDAEGRIQGVQPGNTVVHVHAGSLAAATDVAVTDQPTGSSLVNECSAARMEWIWCDDFEANRLASYFEYDEAGGDFTRVSSVGVSASSGMRARFGAGQQSAGSLKLAFGRTPQAYFDPVDTGDMDYREVYWRVFVRHQAGWIGGGGDKLSRATIFASPSTWAQAMIAHVWSGQGATRDYLLLDPASGTDEAGNLMTITYNDFANLRWLGAESSDTPIFDSEHIGEWYCIEAHVRLNDAGQSNGAFRLWIDDALEAERLDMNWIGAYDDYGLNAVFLENYWNDGSPAAQERYFDNFVVSTERIGCGD